MANLTDPRIIGWSDQRARTLADAIERMIALVSAYQADYVAQGIAALITAGGGTNLIADSSVTGPDGRQQVTGNQVGVLKQAVDALVTALTVTTVGATGSTIKQIVDQIQVNGTLR